MNVNKLLTIALVLICFTSGFAQSDWYQENGSNSSINLEIKKTLNPLRVLYIAAHPDDENTRLISWMVNDLHAEVAYLSLTNGSGGQNLISEQIGPSLGAIREQELYAARRIDGGEQYFTSALDFGYSKSHEETFEKWDKQKILAEVVYRIRAYKPDVIITRFSPSTDGLRSTHGHHTASAILAVEAFQAAADPNRFTDQLKTLSVWETDAIYWNTSWWSYGSQEKIDSIANANPDLYVKIDVDEYVPELGLTTSEIASASRSSHKSQGFGTKSRYGEQFEYLQLLRGKARARDKLNKHYVMLSSYSHTYLRQAMRSGDKSTLILKGIERGRLDNKLSSEQQERLKQIWLKSLGLKVFATTQTPLVQAGEVNVKIELIHYGDTVIRLEGVQLNEQMKVIGKMLKTGQLYTKDLVYSLDKNTQPFVHLTIAGVHLKIPLIYRSSDPVIGEIVQPTQVVEAAAVHVLNPHVLDINGIRENVKIQITPVVDITHIQGVFNTTYEWAIQQEVDWKAHQTYTLELRTPAFGGDLEFQFNHKHQVNEDIESIQHDHLPWTYLITPLKVIVHRAAFQCDAKRIGYVVGAGDKMPVAMRSMGLEVELIDYTTIGAEELAAYDAVVFGIRALNVHADIGVYMDKFYNYAETGGTLIMQYNTAHRLKVDEIGPKGQTLQLSRGRVTQEDAEVVCIEKHRVLSSPNKIEEEQWQGWVQERGLYFPSDWTTAYASPLKMNDEGEEPLSGSLLIMNHGEGHFVYTGLSFFRELPAGVDGAYKLWANILSL